MEEKDLKYVVGIDRAKWIVLCLCVCLMAYFTANGYERTFSISRPVWLILAAGIIALVGASRSFSFDSKYIRVKYFYITVRKIPWYLVQQRILFREWKDDKGIRTDAVLLLTFGCCEPYVEGYDRLLIYKRSHISNSLAIFLQQNQIDSCIDALQKMGQRVEEVREQ